MNVKTMCSFVISFFNYKIFSKKFNYPKVLNIEDSINYLLENPNVSLARIGDGEIRWANNIYNGDGFQDNDVNLAKELLSIMRSDEDNLKLAVPDVFSNAEKNLTIQNALSWIVFLNNYHREWNRVIQPDYVYLDANLSRLYIDRKDKKNSVNYFKKIKKLWDNKTILTVEGEFSLLGYHNDLLLNSKSVKRVIVPSENAYEVVDQIYNFVYEQIQERKIDLVILSVGPTATVLASRLANLYIPVYDLGHFDIEYDWMNMNAKKRVRIPGKFINELDISEKIHGLKNTAVLESVFQTDLNDQVIKKIGID